MSLKSSWRWIDGYQRYHCFEGDSEVALCGHRKNTKRREQMQAGWQWRNRKGKLHFYEGDVTVSLCGRRLRLSGRGNWENPAEADKCLNCKAVLERMANATVVR